MRNLSHHAHFGVVVFSPLFIFQVEACPFPAHAQHRSAGRKYLVKDPLWSTMLTRLCATQSVNVCEQLVKYPWQVAGGELPQPIVICVQSRLFGCSSARLGKPVHQLRPGTLRHHRHCCSRAHAATQAPVLTLVMWVKQ